ncbi:MAG TPA: hypothetical protein VJY35_06675 [Candidatus Eisenbacteria bacterium]|nr:hypothetical protein [Candidatus Eisenbacteria bacterium]
MTDRMVSEDLFRRQLEVIEQLSRAVMDNSTATKGVAETTQQQGRLLEKLDERTEQGRREAIESMRDHVTEKSSDLELHMTAVGNAIGESLGRKMEFYNRPQFWIAIFILAIAMVSGSPLAVPIYRAIGVVK